MSDKREDSKTQPKQTESNARERPDAWMERDVKMVSRRNNDTDYRDDEDG